MRLVVHNPTPCPARARVRPHPSSLRRGHCGVLLVVLLLVAGRGCEPSSPPPRQVPPGGFIAVVGAGDDDPLWPALSGSAMRHHALVSDWPLRTEAPPITSANAQVQLLERLHSEGMGGLCIQVTDPRALAPHLKRLSDQGVVVVTMIYELSSPTSLMHAGLDAAGVGESLAEAIARTLHDKGTIAVLHANSTSAHAQKRYDAFHARLRDFPRITVLREYDCQASPRRARELIKECLRRYPRLNGWVSLENWPLRGLQPRMPLLPPTCTLVTTDPHPPIWDRLEDGTCAALIAADYDEIAKAALSMCDSALQGRIVQWRSRLVGPRAVTATDLHAYKIDWMRWCSRKAAFQP
jgi:ABC-type sugar transport system substrate-binding protein